MKHVYSTEERPPFRDPSILSRVWGVNIGVLSLESRRREAVTEEEEIFVSTVENGRYKDTEL